MSLDLVLKLDDAVDQRLRPRRAAGHVDVDGQELVGALHERVVVEDAGARGAGPHRDHPLRLEHLVVDAADDRRHLDRDAAGEDQHVGLARRGAEDLGAEARRVVARRDHRHHLDRAAGEPEGGRQERVRARPVERLLERRGEHPLLDVLSRSAPVELAAQHVARAQLARAEVAGCRVDLLALYLHSSAPRRHTNTNATASSATKTRISPSTKAPGRLQVHGDRVEEDHLDVEEDEQHRDQVEADPEAEAALHVGREPALVGSGLDLRWGAGARGRG